MTGLSELFLTLSAAVLLVTNTNDSGPGSLREAVERCSNGGGCTIHFAIPGEGPWHTIRLLSPLPPLRGATIDGTTQPDTNPDGPEIELNGSALASGNGLEMLNCGFVRGLTINGFPSNGIVLSGNCAGYDAIIERNYIGCDPTGMLAVPNVRGVWVAAGAGSGSPDYFWRIQNNVIGGNQYSGVFIGAGRALVRGNIIGINAQRNGPLGNGASGVAVMAAGRGSDIVNNNIGFSGHFGVAIAAVNVRVSGNSFTDNAGLAIDRDLDGVSPNAEVAIPEITSARYEDGVTTIVATARIESGPSVGFYWNEEPDPSGYGEGQYFLGEVSPGPGGYVFRYNGDLRGKWVTATATRRYFPPLSRLKVDEDWQGFQSATSEFSLAVLVK